MKTKVTMRQRIINVLSPIGTRVDSVTLRAKTGLTPQQFEIATNQMIETKELGREKIDIQRKSNKARYIYYILNEQHNPALWSGRAIKSVLAVMDVMVRKRPPVTDEMEAA